MTTAPQTSPIINSVKRTKAAAKKRLKSKGWSPARRLAQAQRLRAAAIWRLSTGPKTDSGKARSSRNALKSGNYARQSVRIRQFLMWQNRYRRMAVLWSKARYYGLVEKPKLPALLAAEKRHEKMGFSLGCLGQKLLVSGIQILRENDG